MHKCTPRCGACASAFNARTHAARVLQKIFKIVFAKVFDVKCTVPVIDKVGDPIIEY